MRAVGSDAWIGLSIWQSLFFAVLGVATCLLQRHRLWPLWVAAAWVTNELWFSTWPFSGMPWGRLAFAVADTPLADALPWIGTVGVSFVLALSGTLLAWAVVERGRARLVAAGVPGGTRGRRARCCRSRCRGSPDTEGEATVAVVQGDVPGNGDDILYDFRQVTQNQVDVTTRLADDVAAGASRARLRPVARELHRRRPVPRPADQRRHPGGQRGDRRPDPGRRDRRCRPEARPQPGHRLGPGHRRRGPLHEAPPGRLRRVHPLPHLPRQPPDRPAHHGRPRHGRRHPPGAVAASPASRSRTRSASTSRTTTPSTARSPAVRSCSRCRPATRPSSTPTRSTSSSRSPGCARSRPVGGWRSPRPTASPASSRRTAASSPRPIRAPRPPWSRPSGSTPAITPAVRIGPWSGRLCVVLAALGLLARAGPVSS